MAESCPSSPGHDGAGCGMANQVDADKSQRPPLHPGLMTQHWQRRAGTGIKAALCLANEYTSLLSPRSNIFLLLPFISGH